MHADRRLRLDVDRIENATVRERNAAGIVLQITILARDNATQGFADMFGQSSTS